MEDEVVFVQPVVVGLDQRGAGAFELLLDDLLREAGEVGVPNPATGEANERVPVAGEWQLENHAEHTVVAALDLGVETLSHFEHQRLDALDHRRALIADVSRGGVLETSFLTARAEDLAQRVEADLFANVE